MVNPAEILEALVTKLRDISDLVGEVDGDEERIFAYYDRFPDRVSLDQAITLLEQPAVMVAWMGTDQGARGEITRFRHLFSLFLRAKAETGDPPDGYYRLYRLIVKGVPAGGDGQPLIYSTVHASCDPLLDIPPIQRRTDDAGVDYFEISMAFIEIGDD